MKIWENPDVVGQWIDYKDENIIFVMGQEQFVINVWLLQEIIKNKTGKT